MYTNVSMKSRIVKLPLEKGYYGHVDTGGKTREELLLIKLLESNLLNCETSTEIVKYDT